jgi:hypothetical protein
MSKPIFKIGEHDYTKYIADEGLQPSRNDLDADGSGRNLLDGLMYRSRIATKLKWTVSFLRLDEAVMSQLTTDLDADFVSITMLDSKLNRHVTRTYYCSTINEGVQRYIGGRTVYDGVTFNLIER